MNFGIVRSESEKDDLDYEFLADLLTQGTGQEIGYFLEKKQVSELDILIAMSNATAHLEIEHVIRLIGWKNCVIEGQWNNTEVRVCYQEDGSTIPDCYGYSRILQDRHGGVAAVTLNKDHPLTNLLLILCRKGRISQIRVDSNGDYKR